MSGSASTRSSRSGIRGARALQLGVLALLVAGLFFGSVLLGDYTVTFPDFFRILGGQRIPGATFIVMESKLPKACAGLLAGLSFGLSGALFQSLLRNPLASPDIIGVNFGASSAAVVAILLFGASGPAISASAVAGALLISALIYLLAMRGRSGAQAGGRLILIGIGLAAMLQAMVSALLAKANLYDAQEALLWLSGSLNRVVWERIGILAAGLCILLPWAAWMAFRLRMLHLGDELAQSLGVPVQRVRLTILVIAVLLSALAVSVTGPIGFVAFLAGPLSRLLTGRRLSLAAAALMGAVLVLAAQFVSVVFLSATPMPVGLMTSMVGAPVLIGLLLSERAQSRRRAAGSQTPADTASPRSSR